MEALRSGVLTGHAIHLSLSVSSGEDSKQIKDEDGLKSECITLGELIAIAGLRDMKQSCDVGCRKNNVTEVCCFVVTVPATQIRYV